MEVTEEPSTLGESVENVKNNVKIEEPQAQCTEAEIGSKPNGLVEDDAVPSDDVNVISEKTTSEGNVSFEENGGNGDQTLTVETETTIELPSTPNLEVETQTVVNQSHENDVKKEDTVEITDDIRETVNNESEFQGSEVIDETTIEESSIELSTVESFPAQEINDEIQSDNLEVSEDCSLRFKTEVIVEVDENDVKENDLNKVNSDEHVTKNILSEFDQSIELSEVLRSSDVTDNVENNNCSGRQEVFNKEELLDILQGKDDEPSSTEIELIEMKTIKTKSLEAQLALQQLTRLKNIKKKNRIDRTPRAKKCEKKEEKKIDSIINVLVKDWDDEETAETAKSTVLVSQMEPIPQDSDVKDIQLQIISKEELQRTSIDSTTSEDNNQKCHKSGDETQPMRRFGRIIKKKVIFDPDNPDTFTKGKSVTKNKDGIIEKDLSSNKKIKTEVSIIRSKSKSPIIPKLQWKKPSPKTVRQNKRLTEVDKLLMDEGAVNMIYQLTPEAPKGKKNVKTKAEFIKKLQSSTPDSKEMKFRERKKDSSKHDDGEAKRILGGKHRVSLSSSVKSPSVCEDFEAHSADDSIIYRRHSSSSYSSTCMSPRRLSDVDSSGAQNTPQNSQIVVDRASKIIEEDMNDQATDTFMSESVKTPSSEIINRDDCLSIKEKLNTKLSLALNKRKRECSKNDKPPKQKKLKEYDIPKDNVEIDFKSLSINIDKKLAEICIQKLCKYNIGVIRELEQALLYVNGRKDISVTLLTSQCGTLCSSLDLKPLLDEDDNKRTVNAFEIAESIRSLLSTVEEHSKLLCTGVWGACCGVALALVARSDLALGSEQTTFSLAASPQHVTLQPGLAAITAHCNTLSQSLINDLVFFGRRISAAEAQQGGLLSRCLWPEHFPEQLRSIVKDIAAQPAPNILLKKQLLSIRKNSETVSTFLSCLETERDLLIDYWTSIEGQKLLRADQEST